MAVALPDIPRWVEPRSLLLSGECEVFGAGEGGFVVRDPEDVGISIVGHPSASAIREAVARGWEDDAVFSSPESRSLVSEALPEWEFGSAIFHLTDDLSKFLDALTGTARIVEPSDIDFDEPSRRPPAMDRDDVRKGNPGRRRVLRWTRRVLLLRCVRHRELVGHLR
jgi:hypothetical protein